jgi:hypothetical protein
MLYKTHLCENVLVLPQIVLEILFSIKINSFKIVQQVATYRTIFNPKVAQFSLVVGKFLYT